MKVFPFLQPPKAFSCAFSFLEFAVQEKAEGLEGAAPPCKSFQAKLLLFFALIRHAFAFRRLFICDLLQLPNRCST